MNFNQLDQSRLIAEDHMKNIRQEAKKSRLLASQNSSIPAELPAKAGRFSLRRLFSLSIFGRRNSDQAQPL